MKEARLEALMAEELSVLLQDTYQNIHVPRKTKLLSRAGFTKSNFLKNPNRLYMFLIISAYDRRPFIGSEGSYSYVWGLRDQEESLYKKIEELGLADPVKVLEMKRSEIKDRLKKASISGFTLDDDGTIDFSKTFHNIAFTWEYLYGNMVKAGNSKDIGDIYNVLIHIHGFSEIIASKLIKYLFREINLSGLKRKSFPLFVVWPLIKDYYIEQGIIKIRNLGKDILPLAMGLLLEKGDPFALDAIYYLERYEPEKIDKYINKMNNHEKLSGSGSIAYGSGDIESASMDKAELLLRVIKEISNDSAGLRIKDLEGLVQPRRIKLNANRVYKKMKQYAYSGDIESMYLYYQKCLVSEEGAWDWLLENCGRKSMRSEWERFQAIYEE